MKDVKIENMDWVSYHELTKKGACKIILPIGAIEQHGPHMSLNPDVLIPSYIAEKVAEKAGNMLVAPAISYGYKSQVKSGGGNFFPGTTCVTPDSMVSASVNGMSRLIAKQGKVIRGSCRGTSSGSGKWRRSSACQPPPCPGS